MVSNYLTPLSLFRVSEHPTTVTVSKIKTHVSEIIAKSDLEGWSGHWRDLRNSYFLLLLLLFTSFFVLLLHFLPLLLLLFTCSSFSFSLLFFWDGSFM